MAQMHELTLFIGVIPRRGIFLFDVAPTREIEFPYRIAPHCFLVHFWPGKALCIGRWQWSGLTEKDALMQALEGYEIGDTKKSYLKITEGIKQSATDTIELG